MVHSPVKPLLEIEVFEDMLSVGVSQEVVFASFYKTT
jgi:hypothetical protein